MHAIWSLAGSVRTYATVVVACELPTQEELAVVGARAVTYYQIPGRDQRVGFIGAMTNLHFCESCNKLRLTCDGCHSTYQKKD